MQFDHFSVKEYLISEHSLEALKETQFFYTTPLLAHLTIAKISITYLTETNEVDLAEEIISSIERSEEECWARFPLLGYSNAWWMHVQHADAIDTVDTRTPQPESRSLRCQIHKLFSIELSQTFHDWFLLFRGHWWRSGRYSYTRHGKQGPLFIASFLGLRDSVQRLPVNRANVEGDIVNKGVNDEYNGVPIITKPVLIAALGHELEILRLLLDDHASLEQSDISTVARLNVQHEVDVFTTILQARPDLRITADVVVASAKNRRSLKLFSYLLDAQDFVTGNLLVHSLQNFTGGCGTLLALRNVLG